jgi:tight adherence protein C
MIAFAIALGLTACYAMALYGFQLVRDRGPVERLAPTPATSKPPRTSVVKRVVKGLSNRLGPKLLEALPDFAVRRMRRRLELAGRSGAESLREHAGRKAAYTAIFGAVGVLLLLRGAPLFALVFLVLGWLWADIWLSGEGRRRQARIDRELPDFLDILAVTVGAGMAFQPAVLRVSEATGGPLGDEFRTALRQMEIGASRREAFRAVRERNDSASLTEFITSLLQAEELGVSLTEAMSDLAAGMRRSFYQDARRRAARAAPRISLIVTTLIMPAAVLLILAAMFVRSDLSVGGLFG